ncbi:hypothetical protein [Georgenia sp. SUBG003]|uniref:hypothetical protein n=1 Tax=Georgenia sp. SUBG003 TaxID=1497974 RepID=UPI003AB14023
MLRAAGRLVGGGLNQLVVQVIIAVVAMIFTAVTTVIGLGLKAVMGWRVSEDVEVSGIDQAEHGESAYEALGVGRFSTDTGAGAPAPVRRSTTEANA